MMYLMHALQIKNRKTHKLRVNEREGETKGFVYMN